MAKKSWMTKLLKGQGKIVVTRPWRVVKTESLIRRDVLPDSGTGVLEPWTTYE